MYKSDRQRIEDAIIPSLLEFLMVSQIKQIPDREKDLKVALELLQKDLRLELSTDKLQRRVRRIEKKVTKYMEKDKCEIRKAYMIVSYLAASLDEQGAILLGEGTRQVLMDMNETIVSAYDEEGILKQDKSAAKQVPKILKILQDEGLF
jgi:hypothetical protein